MRIKDESLKEKYTAHFEIILIRPFADGAILRHKSLNHRLDKYITFNEVFKFPNDKNIERNGKILVQLIFNSPDRGSHTVAKGLINLSKLDLSQNQCKLLNLRGDLTKNA